jgi:hypothetical protein
MVERRGRERSFRTHGSAIRAAIVVAFGTLAFGIMAFGAPLAQAQNLTYSEFELGVLDHDARFLEGKEDGADINAEFDLQSPVDDAWAARLPFYLRWAAQPRAMIGLTANTAGDTDEFYFGANWKWLLAKNLVDPGDGVTFAIGFGPGFNDGEIRATQDNRKSLGGNVLFRESFDLGYRINPRYDVSAYLSHISNGGFDRYNQSINDVGLRFGIRF